MNYEYAIKNSVRAALIAYNNRYNIEREIELLSGDIYSFTDGVIRARMQDRTKPINFELRTGITRPRSYMAIEIYNVDSNEYAEICEITIADDGFPCLLIADNSEFTCNNIGDFHIGMSQIIETNIVGVHILHLTNQLEKKLKKEEEFDFKDSFITKDEYNSMIAGITRNRYPTATED